MSLLPPSYLCRIALQAANGQFVNASQSTGLRADRGAIGGEELMWMTPQGGDKVAFETGHRTYVCAEGGGGREVVANRAQIGPWETFTPVHLGGRKFAVRTASGHLLCAEGGGGREVVANRTEIGPWETFVLYSFRETDRVELKEGIDSVVQFYNDPVPKLVRHEWHERIGGYPKPTPWMMIDLGEQRVALGSGLHGPYWCAEGGGGREVVVNRGAVGAWEMFTLTPMDGDQFTLRTLGGHYLGFPPGDPFGRPLMATFGLDQAARFNSGNLLQRRSTLWPESELSSPPLSRLIPELQNSRLIRSKLPPRKK